MNTTEELEAFRIKWKNELSHNSSTVQSTAKQMYLRGVQLEREGYCYEAIEYFRQALKVAPDIEKHVDIRNDTFLSSSTDNQILGFQKVCIVINLLKSYVSIPILNLNLNLFKPNYNYLLNHCNISNFLTQRLWAKVVIF